MGFGQRPCAGAALSLPKASAKQRPCGHGSGLALSVIASRCHLSQSERPWQSGKFPVLYFTPCCRKKSRQALRSDFPPLPRAPPLGELDAVRRPERARMLPGRLRPGLAGAYDRADFRKPQSKLTRCVLVSGLALSVIAPRCHLSQSERPWQSVKFPVYTLRPAAARGAVRRYAQTSCLCQGLPLWGSWREAPERASPAEGRLRLCLALRKIRQKRGCFRGGCAPV